jgi:hypothetical protein
MLFSNLSFCTLIAPVVCIQLPGSEILEAFDGYLALFEKIGWWEFIISFQGYNIIVSRAFAQSFNGKLARVGDIEILVDETLITEATRLPVVGEKWSKNFPVRDIRWGEFLVSKKVTYNPKGMHVTLLKNKWLDLTLIDPSHNPTVKAIDHKGNLKDLGKQNQFKSKQLARKLARSHMNRSKRVPDFHLPIEVYSLRIILGVILSSINLLVKRLNLMMTFQNMSLPLVIFNTIRTQIDVLKVGIGKRNMLKLLRQLRGGVNQLLLCLNNLKSIKPFLIFSK